MTNAEGTMMGFTPTYELNDGGRRNDGMFGGDSSILWIFLLFMLFGGMGGAGFGRNAAVADSLNNDFLYTQSKIDALRQDLTNQTTLLNQSLNTGLNQVNVGICGLEHTMDVGFCGVNRSVDQVRFENAQNTSMITNTVRDEASRTRDLINTNTMQELRDRLNEAQIAASNANQTNSIINALRPYPVPAYAV